MKLFFHYTETNKRLELDVLENQSVIDLKHILEDHFKLDTSSSGLEDKRIILEYGGSDMNDNWILNDLTIPTGSTIRCFVKDEKIPDFYIFVKFQKETLAFCDTDLDPNESTVLELRIFLSREIGLPLSIFRLKSDSSIDLYDEKLLSNYNITKRANITLETWQGWDTFLQFCVKGYTKQVLKTLSSDDFIRQYQLKVGLFMSAHYGNFDLASTLMNMGARADRPVGEHPCRQWCQKDIKDIDYIDRSNKIEYLKLEYLKCPIHASVLNGQLKVLSLFSKVNVQILEQRDGYNLAPWRLALHNTHKDAVKCLKQKEVAMFLLTKQFGAKVKISDNCNVSIHLYSKIRNWIDRAKEKVLFFYGISKSSIKKRPFHKGGLVGNKVLVDGYNNNFKDQVNSYERLRTKYKFYYFIDQDDKDKHGYPDLYFKTVGLIKPTQPINFSKKKQTQVSDKPVPKTLPLWKKAVNTILFRKIIIKYSDILIELGVEIDLEELSLGDEIDEKKVEQETTPTPILDSRKKNSKLQIQKLPVRVNSSSRVTSLSLAKNKIIKESNGKLPMIKSQGQINLKQTNSSKAGTKLPNVDSTDMSNSVQIFNVGVSYFEEQYNRIRKNKHKDNLFTLREDLKQETMNMYNKYREGASSYENAKQILKDVNTFKSKSWLQQINLGAEMAKGNARRLIKKHSESVLSKREFVN